VAPDAVQVTAFQEDDDPDSGSVVNGVTLDIEYVWMVHLKIIKPPPNLPRKGRPKKSNINISCFRKITFSLLVK
jgi:hypothetical protein